jgi:hypothetical protein
MYLVCMHVCCFCYMYSRFEKLCRACVLCMLWYVSTLNKTLFIYLFYLLVRVGDGDGHYGEQWNLSGDRRVSIVLRDLIPRPQAVLFYRLNPSVFHKTLSKYTPKNSCKMRFFYMSRAKYVHFLICKLPN